MADASINTQNCTCYFDDVDALYLDIKACSDAAKRFYAKFGRYPTFEERDGFMNQEAMDAFWASRPI